MDKVIVLIVIGGLMFLLAYAFFQLVRGIFGFSAMHIKATKTVIKNPVAYDVYEFLKKSSVNGEIPDYAIDHAIQVLVSKGLSIDEIYNFIYDCQFLSQIEANKIRNRIERYENRIRNIREMQVYATKNLDSEDVLIVDSYLEGQKEKLKDEIDYEKQKLGE